MTGDKVMAAGQLFANDAGTTLAAAISNTSVTANLAAGSGAQFPSPGAGQWFIATLVDAATNLLREIVKVTAISGDTVTMVRAQEGTTALSWLAGDSFSMLLTAGSLNQFLQQSSVTVPTSVREAQFTSTASFTVPTQINTLYYDIVAGGGGGGSCSAAGNAAGGGGGGGAALIGQYFATNPGDVLTITIGAGGAGASGSGAAGSGGTSSIVDTTTSTTIASLQGGGGGGNGTSTAATTAGVAGGAGGSNGRQGHYASAASLSVGGSGGGTLLGAGGPPCDGFAAGVTPGGFGGGGSGGGPGTSGGNGAPGYVRLYW